MSMPHVSIAGRAVGPGLPAYLLAEMACAHDGEAGKAKRLVDAALAAGADGVQLQFFRTAELVTPGNPIHELLSRIEFDDEEWADIHAHARASGLHVWACTFDPPSVELALRLGVDAIKLNSSDLSNPGGLGRVASTMDEVAHGLAVARAAGGLGRVVLMHGVQNFPTPVADAHIRRMGLLRANFGLPVGYADHTDAENPAARVLDLAALGLGACLLEKHITLDRAEKGVDHQAALEPEEFRAWVARMREAEAALGAGELAPLTEADERYRSFQKKSVVAARDLAAGAVLAEADVRFLRTGERPELSPGDLPRLLGRRLARAVPALAALRPEDVEAP
jgi:sialic acid synthase SpsE